MTSRKRMRKKKKAWVPQSPLRWVLQACSLARPHPPRLSEEMVVPGCWVVLSGWDLAWPTPVTCHPKCHHQTMETGHLRSSSSR